MSDLRSKTSLTVSAISFLRAKGHSIQFTDVSQQSDVHVLLDGEPKTYEQILEFATQSGFSQADHRLIKKPVMNPGGKQKNGSTWIPLLAIQPDPTPKASITKVPRGTTGHQHHGQLPTARQSRGFLLYDPSGSVNRDRQIEAETHARPLRPS